MLGDFPVLRIRAFCLSTALALFVGACSIHPIPDNVTAYRTEDIVRNVRCEAKATVRYRIEEALYEFPALRTIAGDEVLIGSHFARIRKVAPRLAAKIRSYMGSSIAYEFEFTIDEANDKEGSVGFGIPFLSGGTLDFGGGGSLKKLREGKRTVKTEETFADLVKLPCPKDFSKPDPNIAYPMTGSIGMERIMNTFINLAELGGGKDTFTDVITFTTAVEGAVEGKLVLSPVKNRVRVVGADGRLHARRTDIHKLTVALAFPTEDIRVSHSGESGGLQGSIERAGRGSTKRALEDLCIARAEDREERQGALRFIPPEVYCRRDRRAQSLQY